MGQNHLLLPLTSNRHHLSYDDCLENKGTLQDCSCSIGSYHCIQCCAHILWVAPTGQTDLSLSHWVHFTVLKCICVFVFSCISLHACCIIVTWWGWAWWDWGLIWWLTILLQCFDTVGWVTWPVKNIVPNDLYCVEWDVKPYSTQSSAEKSGHEYAFSSHLSLKAHGMLVVKAVGILGSKSIPILCSWLQISCHL